MLTGGDLLIHFISSNAGQDRQYRRQGPAVFVLLSNRKISLNASR
jgi:hypothetical protein